MNKFVPFGGFLEEFLGMNKFTPFGGFLDEFLGMNFAPFGGF